MSATPAASLPSPTSAQSASPTASMGQTNTAWGRIWDGLPSSVPVYPGAQPASVPGGPASASLVVRGSTVELITAWYKTSFDRIGLQTVVEPPLEDGSRVLDTTGATSGCRLQTRIAKAGALTMVTVLYGADCPFR